MSIQKRTKTLAFVASIFANACSESAFSKNCCGILSFLSNRSHFNVQHCAKRKSTGYDFFQNRFLCKSQRNIFRHPTSERAGLHTAKFSLAVVDQLRVFLKASAFVRYYAALSAAAWC